MLFLFVYLWCGFDRKGGSKSKPKAKAAYRYGQFDEEILLTKATDFIGKTKKCQKSFKG